MKNVFLKFLKIFLVASAVILVILLVFGLVLILDWPWWVGFFLLLAVIGLGIGALFLRKIWLRRREQHFVQQVIEQDETHLKNLTGREKDDLKELQVRWKESIELLRRSHLRKYGNPLYVLPWYLVIGESGSGKTTSINSARLSSPFAEVNRTSGISGTKNCDWWFFEQAIIIDTAGRYAIPIDEDRDKDEWQKFLNLLVKYRKKEPLNGLIVTIAADKLLETSQEALEEDGRNIRRRIDELMRVLGAKFPVYVLVTKCDLIQGMTQFCDHLPEKSLDQPMGIINHDLSTDVTAFQSHAVNTIGERLRNLRILLLHQSESREVDPKLLFFPEEFENLRQGLEFFMKGTFRENPYQETPILRGLFFSSGRQEGSPYSRFLNALGMIGEKEVLPGTSKGLFLHDLFARILPKDRGLFAPTRRAIEWRALTRNLGLTSWIVFGVAVCGLLSFSFVKNLKTIREVSHEVVNPPVLRGEILSDIITIDRFARTILSIDDQNQNWWIPRFGLNESIKVENGLKEKYCSQFQHGFLSPFDKQMTRVMAGLTGSARDEVIGQYVAHLVRRINLLKARLEGQGIETLQAKPQPSYVSLLSTVDQGIGSEIREKFGYLYLNYLVWRSDSGEINNEMNLLQSWLERLLTLKGPTPRWIAAWADKQDSLAYVTLKDFWGGSSPVPGETGIAPAFTRKGKEMIDSFIKEIESALPDPLILANQKLKFRKWYRNSSFEAWQTFGATFSIGSKRLKTREEWQQIAAKVAADEGPYSAFLDKMASDLEPLTEGESLPPWLRQVYQFQMVKQLGAAWKGPMGKVAEKGKKMISTIEKKFSKEAGEASELQLSDAKAYHEYQNALTAVTPALASENQAYQMALQVYSEDPAAGKLPFSIAYGAAAKLKTGIAEGMPAKEMVRNLVTGPFDYLWKFTLMETACYFQNQWEEKVLSETQGATGRQAIQFLLGQDGPVRKFVKGPAAPFIGWRLKRGYYAKEALGGAVPFKASFLSFLNKGTKAHATALTRQTYNVLVKGLPTDANPGARLKPHATRLELQCTDSTQVLANFHYPISKTFNWSPQTCSALLFQIEVGDIILKKKYKGSQAFLNFLQDFHGGRRTFYPKDFPREKASLKHLGIKYIKVNYQFRGDYQAIRKFRSLPEEAPGSIAECWDR